MTTKKIFKTLAAAMLMPAMLLTTACSNESEDAAGQQSARIILPATINATCDDDAMTRASYNSSTQKLAFSTGDQLFVTGTHATAGSFAGTLTWTSGGTFNGEITLQKEFTGNADDLLSTAKQVESVLLPNGYGDYDYLTISGTGASTTYAVVPANAFVAGGKALGVEQLGYETATAYNSGFALTPKNAVFVCAATGLDPNKTYIISFSDGTNTPCGSATSDALGNATFCVAFTPDGSSKTYTITITYGSEKSDVTLGTGAFSAGKIYKVTINYNKMLTTASINDWAEGTVISGGEAM